MSNIAVKESLAANRLVNIISGFIIMFLCGQITIPLQPVPITLQTVGVVLIGLLFKPRDAVLSMLTYLSLGAFGLPVFANFSAGFADITGPTGGYLVGFLAAVLAMTLIQQYYTKNNILIMMMIALLGTMITVFFGILWLTTFIGFSVAIKVGLLPFIIPGIVKSVITAAIVKYIKIKY